MSNVSQNPPRPSSIPWGMALAAVSLLTIGGGIIVWTHREEPKVETTAIPQASDLMVVQKEIEAAPPLLTGPGVHTVAFGVENGTRVVKIRVVPDGDELIVDASTGRLLETRPSRPTAPPPMGKFAAPFAPMT